MKELLEFANLRLPISTQPATGSGVPILEPSFVNWNYFVWRFNKTHLNPTRGGFAPLLYAGAAVCLRHLFWPELRPGLFIGND